MSDKLTFVLDTGEQIPADEITPEQVLRAIALIRMKEGEFTSREVIRRVSSKEEPSKDQKE